MTSDRDPRDDLDPSDWLASQFGESEPAAPIPAPDAPAPATPPQPATPPPPALQYPAAPPEYTPPPATPPPPAAPVAGAPFSWGLTPGGTPDPVQPQVPVQPQPPAQPPAFTPPPVQPPAAPPPVTPPVTLPPTQAFDPEATQAFEFTGQDLEPIPPDPSQWRAAPVDDSIDGMTEVIEAEIVGLATPEGEGLEASALDDLFGDTQFREYADELIPPPPPRGPDTPKKAAQPKGPRAPIPPLQRNLLIVAGSLVAVLALIALFLVGTRLSAVLGPAPAVVAPSASPSPSLIVLPLGPVPPGEYQWDELLGGECLLPWESAWQDTYTVVDCAIPHPAQMVYRGEFDDGANDVYPGIEALQARINLLCTPPTIINYANAGTATDIQVTASFAVDEEDWNDGNRTYFCFVNRASGENLTVSVAVPQVAPTPTSTPAG